MVSLHQGCLVEVGKKRDVVNMAEEIFKSAEDERLLGRGKVTKVREAVGLSIVGDAAALIGEVAIPTGRASDTGAVTGDRVTTNGAGGGSDPGAFGGPVDTLKPVGAASITLGHGAATFCLAGVAGLTCLADPPAGGMCGDDVDVQSFGGGGTVQMKAGNTLCDIVEMVMMSEGVVV